MTKCTRCGSSLTYKDFSNERHYAALRCSKCDKFIKWLPKPETILKNSQNNELIQKLLESSIINDWERKFLENIRENKKLSPKQQDCLKSISQKVSDI